MKRLENQSARQEYGAKLQTAKWQKRRAEILARDNCKCRVCGSEGILNVHHINYLAGADPWDHPDNMLISLCETCHAKAHVKLIDVIENRGEISVYDQIQIDPNMMFAFSAISNHKGDWGISVNERSSMTFVEKLSVIINLYRRVGYYDPMLRIYKTQSDHGSYRDCDSIEWTDVQKYTDEGYNF